MMRIVARIVVGLVCLAILWFSGTYALGYWIGTSTDAEAVRALSTVRDCPRLAAAYDWGKAQRDLYRWGTGPWRKAAGYQFLAYERLGEEGCDRRGRTPTLWG
jgi:hypothetical protein